MRLTATASLLLAASAAAAADLPPAETITPAEVLRTGDYSEGVVVDHEGNLYFSHGKIITKLTPDGKASTWAETGNPNGHKVLADGTHGQPLRGPNDLTLDPQGGFYFTDPGGSSREDPIGTVHYVDPQGLTHTVASGLAFPNGIVLRPGGKELLVGESKQNRILAYPVLAPGKLGEAKVLAQLPAKGEGQIDNQPDGMALDAEGNLFVAHYGMRRVQVVNPQGEVIRHYPGGNLTTSNVAFAGPNLDQLYVTGGEPGALFRLDLGARGLNILPPPAK
jgi:gluconolactonase